MTLGTKLLKIRKELNITQLEIAHLLEVSQPTYCDWESDTARPNFNNLIKICSEFDLDIHDLLKETMEKNVKCLNSFNVRNNYITKVNSVDIMELLSIIIETQKLIIERLNNNAPLIKSSLKD